MNDYYQPANIFRQPAMCIKKTRDISCQTKSLQLKTDGNYKKSWQNDTSKMNSPLLRKASGDINDFYTAKKLKSEYWKISENDAISPVDLNSSLSVSGNRLLVSNGSKKDNLKLYQLETANTFSEKNKLRELQSITVPDKLITSTALLPTDFNNEADLELGHDQLILTGHQDGVVNLITTSTAEGGAKIVRRFKHGKYLKSTTNDNLEMWMAKKSYPIRKLLPWSDGKSICGFLSLVNDSLFIYNLSQGKTPLYLNSFPGIESFDVNPTNSHMLSLSGSSFGENGISILDLRCGAGKGNLYIPGNSSMPGSSLNCKWLDEHTLANSVGNTVKVWDIRNTKMKFDIQGHKGCINALNYYRESQALYSSDDQGYTVCWDLNNVNEHVEKCTLAQGFQSIGAESSIGTQQCGNIVTSPDLSRVSHSKFNNPGSTFLESLCDGSLVTLDYQEIGVHKIYDVETPVPPPRNPLRKPHAVTMTAATKSITDIKNLISVPMDVDSDTTWRQDSSCSTWDNSSEDTMDYEEFGTPTKLQQQAENVVTLDFEKENELTHKPKSASIYSLSEFRLSGSTVYGEHTIHEDIYI